MKVVLLKEVKNLGHVGDVKEVNSGYARNFLIPRGLADMVTKHSMGVLESQKNKRERIKKVQFKSKKLLAKKIDRKKFKIEAKADEKGSLYAKLDSKAIVRELEKQGYDIELNEVIIKENIKKIGDYTVDLKLGGEKAKIKLEVKGVEIASK